NRALITWGKKNDQIIIEEAQEYINLSDDQVGEIGLKEAKSVAKAFGFPNDAVHLFEFHDQDALNQISRGITLAKAIIYDADRVVIPSDNNNHPDHQATHTIAKKAAIKLNLVNAEFYVYAIYNIMKAPMEKQIKIRVAEYRDQIYDIMALYKTQLTLKDTRMGWVTLKRKRSERFGVFNLSDAGKSYNF
ncbi:unnamed protein product, partial [marine sediment metagenome]